MAKSLLKKLLGKVFKKTVHIPSYEEKRSIILSYKKNAHAAIFIETGTFMGDTIESLKTEFDQLYSIELSEELAKKAKERFVREDHIEIIQGSSDLVLPNILVNVNSQAIFWLDGHYSGEFMHGDKFIKTAKGSSNTPVLKELELILNCETKHIILIDDARLFNGSNDYPTIKRIKQILKSDKRQWSVTVARDIIRILPVH